MYLAIIILPLLAWIASGFFGRKTGVTGAQFFISIKCKILLLIFLIKEKFYISLLIGRIFMGFLTLFSHNYALAIFCLSIVALIYVNYNDYSIKKSKYLSIFIFVISGIGLELALIPPALCDGPDMFMTDTEALNFLDHLLREQENMYFQSERDLSIRVNYNMPPQDRWNMTKTSLTFIDLDLLPKQVRLETDHSIEARFDRTIRRYNSLNYWSRSCFGRSNVTEYRSMLDANIIKKNRAKISITYTLNPISD